MEKVSVVVNNEMLPVELTALIASVVSNQSVSTVNGDVRVVTLKERGDNIRTMVAHAGFITWLKSLDGQDINIVLDDADDDGQERRKVVTVASGNFIPFLKLWATKLATAESLKTMATVTRTGVWGVRGRQSTRENALDVLSRGLDALDKIVPVVAK